MKQHTSCSRQFRIESPEHPTKFSEDCLLIADFFLESRSSSVGVFGVLVVDLTSSYRKKEIQHTVLTGDILADLEGPSCFVDVLLDAVVSQ